MRERQQYGMAENIKIRKREVADNPFEAIADGQLWIEHGDISIQDSLNEMNLLYTFKKMQKIFSGKFRFYLQHMFNADTPSLLYYFADVIGFN